VHDALRVSDGNREIVGVENESNEDFLGTAISVISKTDRPKKPASRISFYALIRCNVSFIRKYLKSIDCVESLTDRRSSKSINMGFCCQDQDR